MNKKPRKEVPYRIRITTREVPKTSLDNLSAFLYDLALLHDRLVLIESDSYRCKYLASPFFYHRSARRLREEDRLRILSFKKESPSELVLVVGAALSAPGAAWVMLRIIEKLVDWPEDRKIKRLERERMELKLRRLIEEGVGHTLERKHSDERDSIVNATVKDPMRLGSNEDVKVGRVETLETIRPRDQDVR